MNANQTATLRQPGEPIGAFLKRQIRPMGKHLTAFNIITIAICIASAIILYFRFTEGLGAVSNLSQEQPWGLMKGFNVVAGVAFAGGAYVLCFLVYVLRVERYHAVVRVTVLNGFLAYSFYAGALLLDLGRPWKVMNPIIGNDFGLTSVLFLVSWHFMLYMMAQFVEFSPAIAEWIGWRRLHRILTAMTIGTVVFGICLSTLHQSALGALYLMAKEKIHPLWYSEFIPILFLVSSIFAGLALVIVQGAIVQRVFAHRVGHELAERKDDIVIGLSRIAGGAAFVYLFIEIIAFIHGHKGPALQGGWAAWYLLENAVLIGGSMVAFIAAAKRGSVRIAQGAALLAIAGVLLNRVNVSMIAFRWDMPVRYVPTWQEFVISASILAVQFWIFRWAIRRLPVLGGEPEWAQAEAEAKAHAVKPLTAPGLGAAKA